MTAATGRRLAGRVALITGTGGGQGREAALRFAAEGAIVVGCDLKEEGNAETVDLVRAAGGQMHGQAPLDLGDYRAATDWVTSAAEQHGRIDIVYNNASSARFEPVAEIPLESWRYTIRNELDLVFFVTQAAWPHLCVRGGVIINVASVQALIGRREHPGLAHAATKGAVIAMTRQLATEGGPHGVRAVCISPGAIETPETAELLAIPEVREAVLSSQLIGRIGQPSDIAELAVHLASDAGSFISGANFVVDGGVTVI